MTALNAKQDHFKRIEARNNELVSIIQKTKVDASFAYDNDGLLDSKIKWMVENCDQVLDFGKSSRHRFDQFNADQIETADIVQYEGYPDIFVDICDAETFPAKSYDGIICNAVIEHVYEPGLAVKNMHKSLKDGGVCLCYAPFVFRYHAPDDLHFQDYFRFTRDGLAYLFRDFSEVTLYPVRGETSAWLFLKFGSWKYRFEKRWPAISRWADRLLGGFESKTRTTGYTIWAVK